MKSLAFNKEMQFKDIKLTDEQCQDLYNQWYEGNIKLVVDSPIGKRIFKWLEKQNQYDDNDFKKFNVSTFRAFKSPIDGTMIASRKQLADHERRYGVKQVGNDFNNITRKEQ